MSVFQSDSSQGQHWDPALAYLCQKRKAGWLDVGRGFFSKDKFFGHILFKDWSEDREICFVSGSLGYFLWGVTGDSDDWILW